MGRVYTYRMDGSRYLFADECRKKHLLDLLWTLQEKAGWLIYAFCVMDNSAWFIIETDRISLVTGRIREETAALLQTDSITDKCRKLETLDEIADCSRMIHRLPYEAGIVERIRDYWWSSYVTYMGIYEWPLVNCKILAMYFSADPLISRRKMEQYHRQSASFTL